MADTPKRPLLKQLTEGLLAVALVLVFFFIIMLVLNALFPYGGLQLFAPSDVNPDAGIPGRLRPEQRIEVAFGHADQTLDPGKWAATLVEMRNLVKSKRATDIAWKSAEADMPLYSLDAVQTLEDSSARIRFDARNEIHLGANSLVVIRRMEQDLLFREKRTFMVVVDGELRGRLGGEENGNVFLEVTTPNAVARLKTGDTGSEPVEFSIRVDEDNRSSVTLFSGTAEIEASGETVRLGANQITHIDGQSTPSAPVALPTRPILTAPANDARFIFRDLPPRVVFHWQAPAATDGFRLQIARAADFSDLLLDEVLTTAQFTHGNLPPGSYFWRVSGRTAGAEGGFCPARKFNLTQDRQPPLLEVEPPPAEVTAATLELSGRSEPEARVYIGATNIPLSADGTFHHRLTLEAGMNVIVIEAADAAGNVSYSSHQLYARLEKAP